MALYRHNGATPAPLPFRIRIPDGNGTHSRTDPATFTPEEVAAAGYVEADAQPDPVTGDLGSEEVDVLTARGRPRGELVATLLAPLPVVRRQPAMPTWPCTGRWCGAGPAIVDTVWTRSRRGLYVVEAASQLVDLDGTLVPAAGLEPATP